jgi:hypothetical protein
MTFNAALLATASLSQLVALHNLRFAKPVKGFSTKPLALARIEKLAVEAGLQAELVDGKVDLVVPAPVKVEKAPKASNGNTRGPKPTHDDTAVITLLANTNPKRAGTASYTRFALYRTGMTVGQFLDAAHKLDGSFGRGRWRSDLDWDVRHGSISVAAAPAKQVKAA